jgi:Tfp pilus assembly protein PilF
VGFFLLLLCASGAAEQSFELSGRLAPAAAAVIHLQAATDPFTASTLAGPDGHFHFSGILSGSYTLSVSTATGEWRQTVDVGPRTADDKGRVGIVVHLDAAATALQPATVSASELAVPNSAWKAYRQAQGRLAKHDTDGAVELLKRATEIAPRFCVALNQLGTISYHRAQFKEAEQYFRRALEADPDSYAPLVNLGGVLLDLGEFHEAWNFNVLAATKEPGDALAHSQLGITAFHLGKLDLAVEQLREAIRLDPGHFSSPQLVLADVYLRLRRPGDAADVLEDFVGRHPDSPLADRIRSAIGRLREQAAPAGVAP